MIFLYLSLVTFVIGHVYRYRYDQYGWTPKSSRILERRLLIWSVLLFHWGLLSVIGGHAMGLLVPIEVYDAMGVSDHDYHLLSLWAGSLVGFVALVGILLLNLRRWFNRRVRASTEAMKFVVDGLLLVIILGMAATVGYRVYSAQYELQSEFEYRETIGPWFRSLFIFRPEGELMVQAPLVSLDARSWGDSVGVNVRGFLYAAGAESGALDRAGSAARRTVREELKMELSGRDVGVSGSVPNQPARRRRCAESSSRPAVEDKG